MSEFKQYRRTQIAEMRPVTQHEAENQDAILDNGISVSQADLENGSPKIGDMIARNPKNHKDQWLVAKQYFQDNFEPMCFIMNWIDKNKQMPPIGEFEDISVYVHVTNGKLIGHGTYNYDRKVWTYHMTTWSEQDDNEITHWMPLLKLPSEK